MRGPHDLYNPDLVLNLFLSVCYSSGFVAFLLWLVWIRPRKGWAATTADVLGWLAIMPVALVDIWLHRPLDTKGWFIIFTVLTVGALPLGSLVAFILFGRGVARAILWLQRRYAPEG